LVKDFVTKKLKNSRNNFGNKSANQLRDSTLILPRPYLNENDRLNLNEKAILIYLNMEKEKFEFEDTVEEEYVEKVIMFGYIVLFGSAYTFAPLVVLIITMLDLRTDAYRILWLYKRPVGHRAQNIGL
jgi:hypothetical protein